MCCGRGCGCGCERGCEWRVTRLLQYHESEPFRFKPGYYNRRVNLTLLFGDRWSPRLTAVHGPPPACRVPDAAEARGALEPGAGHAPPDGLEAGLGDRLGGGAPSPME